MRPVRFDICMRVLPRCSTTRMDGDLHGLCSASKRGMLVHLVMLGALTLTAYQPIPSQTDDSPTWTSIGDRTTKFGCAVSQDLLLAGVVRYGDILYIPGYGFRVINDTMNKRHKQHIDLLVFTRDEEKAVGIRKVRVYRVSQPMEERNVRTVSHKAVNAK